MVRRYAAGAAAGTALAVSLTGCLGDGGKSKAAGDGTPSSSTPHSASQALSQVSEKSGTIKSFRATMSSTTTVGGQETRISGDIAYRLKPQPAMKMNFPHMSVGGKATKGFEEILLGDTIYVKLPALTQTTDGKTWLKFSLSRLSAKSGVDLKGLMSQAQQADLSMTVKMLTASNDAHKVGTDKIGGDSTTHYQGTYSTQDALAKLGTDQRAQAQKALGQAGLDKMVFDLWVDGRQLPRKVKITTPAGSRLQTDTTMVYSGFNAPVSITPPPASQVKDGNDLQSPNAPN
jgi:hypothetical protein